MLIRTSIVAGLATVLLSGVASADSKPVTVPKQSNVQKLADRCAALETQFDTAITTHGSAAKAASAKELRVKGEGQCGSNKEAMGIKSLEQALKDLGVKPNA